MLKNEHPNLVKEQAPKYFFLPAKISAFKTSKIEGPAFFRSFNF